MGDECLLFINYIIIGYQCEKYIFNKIIKNLGKYNKLNVPSKTLTCLITGN